MARAADVTADTVRVEPVSRRNTAHLDVLFRRGDARTCRCAYVRLTNAEWSAADVATRDAVHHRAIEAAEDDGRAAGLIAFADDRPVGWVSFDERPAFDRLSSPLLAPVDDLPVWSVVCFVVAPGHRRSGIATRLLDETIAYARLHGAPALEAYPVDTSTGVRTSASDLWRGTVGLFESAGFVTVDVRRQNRTSAARPIMRLVLG